MMNNTHALFFGKPDEEKCLGPTARLFVLALYPDHLLTIGELTEFTGSTPFMIQRLGTQLVRKGLIARHRNGRVTRYSLATPAASPQPEQEQAASTPAAWPQPAA
jgi:hypothetical protein